MDSFRGRSFHTYYWPHEPVELAGKRVAVIGTGATAIQIIGEIADKVGELTVFQRRPNWSAPLNNCAISDEEMADIRARYDEIFATCARTPGGFVHEPDRRGFYEVSREERLALWDRLYDEPGFGIWLGNFREIFTDEAANAEFSAYIADRIRRRVNDPVVAEKLIPKDHGFGVQRVPLETNYFEAYNRDNVHLVDISETPIERITDTGLRTTERDYDVRHHRLRHRLRRHHRRLRPHRHPRASAAQKLRDKWKDGPSTFLGMHGARLPEPADADRAAERFGLDQFSARHRDRRQLVHATCSSYMWERGYTRAEATAAAQQRWTGHVAKMYAIMLHAQSQGLVHRLQLQRRRPRGRARSATSSTTAARRNMSRPSTTSSPRAMRKSFSRRIRGQRRGRWPKAPTPRRSERDCVRRASTAWARGRIPSRSDPGEGDVSASRAR